MPKFISDDEMAKIDVAQNTGKRFISDEQMNEIEPEPAPKASGLESVGRGVGQGASLGLIDEASGVAGALGLGGGDLAQKFAKQKEIASAAGDRLGQGEAALTQDMKSQGFSDGAIADQLEWLRAKEKSSPGFYERYKGYRDQARSLDDKASADNPGLFATGQIGGGVALPGTSMKALVSQGAVSGFGQGEGATESVLGAGVGAGLGAVASKAADALAARTPIPGQIGAGARTSVANSLDKLSEGQAIKNLGMSADDILKLGEGQARDLGRYARDADLLDPVLFGAQKTTQGLVGDTEKLAQIQAFKNARNAKDLAGKGGVLKDGLIGGAIGAGVGGAAFGIPGFVAGVTKNVAEKAIERGAGSQSLKRAADLARPKSITPQNVAEFAQSLAPKYASVLKSLAAQGEDSFRVNEYLLRQNDPEYRQQINQAEDDRTRMAEAEQQGEGDEEFRQDRREAGQAGF